MHENKSNNLKVFVHKKSIKFLLNLQGIASLSCE